MNRPEPSKTTKKHLRLPPVRVLVVVTMLLAAGTVFVTVVLPYRQQMAAIEHIEEHGGSIETEPVGPEWLRDLVGEERMKGFDRVLIVTADCQTTPDTTATLKEVSILRDVRLVYLFCTWEPEFTPAGVNYLNRLRHLNRLFVFPGDTISARIQQHLKRRLPQCEIEFSGAIKLHHLLYLRQETLLNR